MLIIFQDWYQVYLDIGAEVRAVEALIERLVRPWRPTFAVLSWVALHFIRFFLGWVIGALNNIIFIISWLLKPLVMMRDSVVHWLGLL